MPQDDNNLELTSFLCPPCVLSPTIQHLSLLRAPLACEHRQTESAWEGCAGILECHQEGTSLTSLLVHRLPDFFQLGHTMVIQSCLDMKASKTTKAMTITARWALPRLSQLLSYMLLLELPVNTALF